MEKKRDDIPQLFKSKFTGYIKPAFATGNWSAIKSATKSSKVGISQLFNRHNYIASLSRLRRVVTPSDKNSRIIKPRHLHSSQWNMLCPAESPEGQTTGLIRNMSMMTLISIESSPEVIVDLLEQCPDVQMITTGLISPELHKQPGVFVNGCLVGITKTPDKVARLLRVRRRRGEIFYQTSVSVNKAGLRIFTDEGRVMAPFFICLNGALKPLPEEFSWDDLIEHGIIEYLDPSELETIYHSNFPWAIEKEHTHSLIHPCFILGVSASTIPFPDHNQSPRNVYQSAMGKQALGIFAGNFESRLDTTAHILCYPQRPLLNTFTQRAIGAEELPSGENLIIAVMCAAYNQEDSIVANRRALDNGALRSINYTTYSESYHRKGNVTEEIKKPEKMSVKETRLTGYANLDLDGLCPENVPLSKRDVVIGKTKTQGQNVKDASTIVKTNGMDDGAVIEMTDAKGTFYVVGHGSASIDKALISSDSDSFRIVKVRVRQMRVPQIGDKVASRSAQKGIIGMIFPPEDMPYSEKTGMVPDLIMNPNAMPSRMTISQPLEAFLGKACAMRGEFADCTPFEPAYKDEDGNFPVEIAADELKKYGFLEHGDEVMINGMTGERMDCKIFMGPTYYQRLKHMVDDKIHSRDQNGPREILTRQPVEGRKHGGGFRVGEMEVWCCISHGGAKFLIDRMVNNSDGYELYVCDLCGNVAIANIQKQHFECKRCQQNTEISKVKIPYAFKLLVQELQAMGMGIWINVKKDTDAPVETED